MKFNKRREKAKKVDVCGTHTGSLKATKNDRSPLGAYISREGQKIMPSLFTHPIPAP